MHAAQAQIWANRRCILPPWNIPTMPRFIFSSGSSPLKKPSDIIPWKQVSPWYMRFERHICWIQVSAENKLILPVKQCVLAEKLLSGDVSREITCWYRSGGRMFKLFVDSILVNHNTWPLYSKKTSSYGYRNPHYKPKTVWRPSQVYNGNPYTKMTMFI